MTRRKITLTAYHLLSPEMGVDESPMEALCEDELSVLLRDLYIAYGSRSRFTVEIGPAEDE